MLDKSSVKPANLPLLSVPAFWPMAIATAMLEQGTELYAKNLKFVDEEIKIHDDLRPHPCDTEPSAARSANHDAARLRQAGAEFRRARRRAPRRSYPP